MRLLNFFTVQNDKKKPKVAKTKKLYLYYVKFLPNGSNHYNTERVYASQLREAKAEIEKAYPLHSNFTVIEKSMQ